MTEYVTLGGERWDTIAYLAYGDSSQIAVIRSANPGMPMATIFSQGIRLMIPIVELTEQTDVNLLPPWKRLPSDSALDAANAVPTFTNIQTTPSGGSFDDSFE